MDELDRAVVFDFGAQASEDRGFRQQRASGGALTGVHARMERTGARFSLDGQVVREDLVQVRASNAQSRMISKPYFGGRVLSPVPAAIARFSWVISKPNRVRFTSFAMSADVYTILLPSDSKA